jgi:hypothetical protein
MANMYAFIKASPSNTDRPETTTLQTYVLWLGMPGMTVWNPGVLISKGALFFGLPLQGSTPD